MKIKNIKMVTVKKFFEFVSRKYPIPVRDEVIIAGYNLVTSLNEKYILYKLIRILKPMIILEIGTYFGFTALGFARNTPGSLVYTIDICKEMRIDIPRLQKPFVLPRKFVGEAFAKKKTRIRQIYGDSSKIKTYSFLKKKIVDFAFIDGNHSFKGVVRDMQNVLKFMRKGSVLCWHDFKKEDYSEVIQAICYLSQKEKFKIIHIRGTSLAVTFL